MKIMAAWIYLLCGAICVSAGITPAAAPSPYEQREFTPSDDIDRLLLVELNRSGIIPASICSDAVFVRRIYLDAIGTLPTLNEVKTFLADTAPDKRCRLIDRLLEREEYADYWSMKWCDVLRVKSEYPINLWPNAVQAYHRRLRDAVKNNLSYDRFARELLTAGGSNFRVPQVNFYRAVQDRSATGLAATVALTFMGCRWDKLPPKQRRELEKFFSRVAYKTTAEWKEEIVFNKIEVSAPLPAMFPDGRKITIAPSDDPRKLFADWLIDARNPWFARAEVNRTWFWLFGRGLIDEPDDIRPDNPAVNPELLHNLEEGFIRSGYDRKALLRRILNSSTYQQSSLPHGPPESATRHFAAYPIRRLDAEILIDMLCYLSGTREDYSSVIPEPFTFIPREQRTIALADGSITSSFLEVFGRSARDTGQLSERNNRISTPQRLYLLNSNQIQRRLNNSPLLRKIQKEAGGNRNHLVQNIYLLLLSRNPTPDELKIISARFPAANALNNKAAVQDLVWSLINSKEFLYRH